MTAAGPSPAVSPPAVVLQTDGLASKLTEGVAELVWLSVLAGALAAVVALAYRWYVRERVPDGLPILFGLSAVALYLGTSRALSEVIGNAGDPFDQATALANIVTFALALAAARAGADVGDRVGTDVFAATGSSAVESEVSRVVQAVGRVITVEIPDDVDDIVGYDPVPDETKEKLAGRTFVFPRRLTVAELRDRLVTRLKADYAVGHVDVDIAEDGTIEYVALGSRAAGIGPTLPPETAAVAVEADPAFAASAGDLVQVWRTDPYERVLTAEVRATVDDVVTLAVDAADARKLDGRERYKLVTLPVETRPDREFVSLLRVADETMAAVTVVAGSSLAGRPLGAFEVAVAAVRPADGPVEPLPSDDRTLEAGDSVYVVATPEAIRRVESLAAGPGDAVATGSGADLAPDERVDAGTPVADDGAAAPDGPSAATESAERAASAETGEPAERAREPTSASAVPSSTAADGPTDDAASPASDGTPDERARADDDERPIADEPADPDAPDVRTFEDDAVGDTPDPDVTERDGSRRGDSEREGRAVDGEANEDDVGLGEPDLVELDEGEDGQADADATDDGGEGDAIDDEDDAIDDEKSDATDDSEEGDATDGSKEGDGTDDDEEGDGTDDDEGSGWTTVGEGVDEGDGEADAERTDERDDD